jgi:hypothetical protein
MKTVLIMADYFLQEPFTMLVVNLKCGLGNQMFQYALATSQRWDRSPHAL